MESFENYTDFVDFVWFWHQKNMKSKKELQMTINSVYMAIFEKKNEWYGEK